MPLLVKKTPPVEEKTNGAHEMGKDVDNASNSKRQKKPLTSTPDQGMILPGSSLSSTVAMVQKIRIKSDPLLSEPLAKVNEPNVEMASVKASNGPS